MNSGGEDPPRRPRGRPSKRGRRAVVSTSTVQRPRQSDAEISAALAAALSIPPLDSLINYRRRAYERSCAEMAAGEGPPPLSDASGSTSSPAVVSTSTVQRRRRSYAEMAADEGRAFSQGKVSSAHEGACNPRGALSAEWRQHRSREAGILAAHEEEKTVGFIKSQQVADPPPACGVGGRKADLLSF